MGKKTKKRTGKSKGASSQQNNNHKQNNHPQNSKDPKLNSDQKSLYSIYKYCTEAVIEWGRSTYRKKKGGNKAVSFSLSQALFECLGSLANDGILMPGPVLKDLQTAIAYRKRVGAYYRTVPSASEEDHARHEWLIVQLERLEALFASNSSKSTDQAKDNLGDTTTPAGTETGFAALTISDDEESTADEGDEEDITTKPIPRKILKVTPTAEELQAEERLFAISLVLSEIAEVRADLKQIWLDWASKEEDTTDAAEELLAATACTEYAVSAIRKLILQTSIEFQSFDDFEQILQAFGETALNTQEVPETLHVNDPVTIRKLEKRPELNGRHGRIAKGQQEGRYAVQLFPLDGYKNRDKKQTLAIKPENIVLSDNTFLRLSQIYQALKGFSFDSVPKEPNGVYLAPASKEVTDLSRVMIANFDQFASARNNQDFGAFLDLTVQCVLPLWISASRYLPSQGAANTVLTAYVRDFDETKRVTFQLAFAFLVTMDTAFAISEVKKGDEAEGALNLYRNLLQHVYKGSTYTSAIELMNRKNLKSGAFYSHLEFSRHFWGEYTAMCRFFPLVSGETLLTGLRMHLVCGSGSPYSFCQDYATMLHLYWMLRCEGYIGKMPEIEGTLIRMYRQHVFFRGGVPRKGEEGYIKSWQLAIGATLAATKLIDGRRTARATALTKSVGMDGLMVTEISRLLDILQWKSMPFMNRAACFEEIQRIARDECHSVFTAPLIETCTKMSGLIDELCSKFTATARASGERMIVDYGMHTMYMEDISRVCFWGLSLADNRSTDIREKGVGLALLARCFQSRFKEEARTEDTPSLMFSPNDHKVDSSLWGEKGVMRTEHSLV